MNNSTARHRGSRVSLFFDHRQMSRFRPSACLTNLVLTGLLLLTAGSTEAFGSLLIFGREHTALGNAILSRQGRELVVSNIGPGGADGVSIDIAGSLAMGDEFIVFSPSLDDLRSLPVGAFFDIRGIGEIDGVPNQVVSTVHYEVLSDTEYSATVDLSGVNPSSLTARYYREGVLQLTETDLSPSGTALTAVSANLFGITGWSISFPPDVDLQGTFALSSTLGGQSLLDPGSYHIIADAVNGASTFGNYSSMSITAGGGATSIRIAGEQIMPVVPEPSTLALLGLGGLAMIRRRRHFLTFRR